MPTFPAFAQRLAQLNNPLQRAAAETPMQVGGFPVGAATGGNPMRRPRGIDGQIPLIQNNESPSTSGTGAEPRGEALPAMSKIKQRVAADTRYDDIAPKMEQIPETPVFDPQPVKGFKGRVKAAFQAAGAASQMHPNSPYAGLVGLVTGAVKPEIAQGLDYKTRVLPAAQREQANVQARNDARQRSFGLELQNRERLAKINQMDDPQWASVPGGESPTLFEKKSGETRSVTGPDGKPLRAASVVNTEERGETQKEIQRVRDMARAELEAAEAKHKFELAKEKYENERREKEKDRLHKEELEKLKESGRNRRFGQGEAGKNSRNAANLNERKRATSLRYGDEGDKPVSQLDQQINKVSDLNAAKKAKKQGAPPPQ
jgi:hypothetical protein